MPRARTDLGPVAAIYPGSFDPITLGHLDLVRRGASVFDPLIVCVARNLGKSSLFTLDERMDLIRDAVRAIPRVRVHAFDGLLVEAAAQKGARVILRGLRAVSDFDYEFQMAHMNHQLQSEVETIFMMTGEEHFYVSSSLVKEVAELGGDVRGFVPAHVADALARRFDGRRGHT